MTATAEETADNVTELPVKGPGERLRAARVAAGLEITKIAAQLHLRPGQVEELERDHYDSFDARVFVRGYLRNYARLVSLPGESILDAFDALYPDPQEPALKRVGSHKPQVSSRHGAVRLVSWLLLLGILGLFVVWWAGYLELNGQADVAAETPEQAVTAAEAPGLLPDTGGGDVNLVLPPASPQSASPMPEERIEAEVASPAAEPVSTAPDPGPAASVMPPVAEPEAASAPQTGPARIELSLTGPCWVDIRAADGSYRLLGEFQAGTRRVLGGVPPYKILLGNASVASLSIDGRPLDLKPHTSKQIARFVLDPVEQ